MEEKFLINGRELIISGENAQKLALSLEFRRYLETLQKDLDIRAIQEEWSWFSRKGGLIFAIFFVQYIDKKGKNKGEVFFFRSDAVAVFLVVRDSITRQKFAVLVRQVRIPAGGEILEVPAGSAEIGENFEETLVREIKEEVGLEITRQDLTHLGTFYSSPGACNEKIALYACERDCSPEQIRDLRGRLAGLWSHGEYTIVQLVELSQFEELEIGDAKTQLAYELYRRKVMEPKQ